MQPLGTKKSHNLLDQKKSSNLLGQKIHATSQDKKFKTFLKGTKWFQMGQLGLHWSKLVQMGP